MALALQQNYQQWRQMIVYNRIVEQSRQKTYTRRKAIDGLDQNQQQLAAGKRTALYKQQAEAQQRAQARNQDGKQYTPAVSDQHQKAHAKRVRQQVRQKQSQRQPQKQPKAPDRGR